MSSFRGRVPDMSGVPIREITPSTIMGTFDHVWDSPVDHVFYIIPGTLTAAVADSSRAWPLWTRSVVSWEIAYDGNAGGALEIRISNANDVAGDLAWNLWRTFGIAPTSAFYTDGASGLELPAGMFAQFRVYAGISGVQVNMSGSLTLRGV